MIARLLGRAHRNVTPIPGILFGLIVIFLLIEGFFWYLESRNIPIRVVIRFGPGGVCLLLASVLHGVSRVVGFHPIWQAEYRTWLESSPWTNRKPLPLGPVELRWDDGLILGPIILLSSILPEPRAMSLLCAFLLSHLLAVAITLWLTRIWEIGYITAFGLGLGVWLWPRPIACLVVSTVVYVIAYEGLRRGLEQFPWIPRKGVGLHTDLMARGPHEEPCGWPYDRLMREILNDRGFAQIDVILCCMLGAWWLFVLSSFIPDPQNRIASLLFPLIALTAVMAFGRLIIYIEGYQSPITPWARIRTFRWIIPGYDKIFVAPVCTILAGPISVGLLQMYRVPLGVCLPAATGIMVLVALITPPRLRRWRLTGQHRMVSPASRPNTAFVKVG